MKRYFALFFTSILMLTIFLAGCGNKTDNVEEKANKKSEKIEVSTSHQDDRFLFTANEGGSISKISLKEQKVISNLKFEGAVHNIQVSPDGKVVGAVIVPEMMHGNNESMDMKGKAIFLDPYNDKIIDNKFTYVTNMFENTVNVIDNEQNKVIKTIKVGKTPNGISIMP